LIKLEQYEEVLKIFISKYNELKIKYLKKWISNSFINN
jgi:hypothetical protein